LQGNRIDAKVPSARFDLLHVQHGTGVTNIRQDRQAAQARTIWRKSSRPLPANGKQMVLAFISKLHLEDHFRRDRLSGKEANLIVGRNLESFARIVSVKYERGEHRPYSRFGSTLPRVDITLKDIETSGEELTDTVLNLAAGWIG
jgi:hypothetical protein